MIAKITEKTMISKEVIFITFLTKENFLFKPGQYIILKLKETKYNDDKDLEKAFSIINGKEKNTFSLATRLSNSAFKKTLREIEINSEVEISHPNGEFIFLENNNQYVFIAGGIGITPYISMLNYVEKNKIDKKITLLYSNKTLEESIFLSELKNFEKKLTNFKLILTITNDDSWLNENRKINGDFIKEKITNYLQVKYFLAGPPLMVSDIYTALDNLGVLEDNIEIEKFNGY